MNKKTSKKRRTEVITSSVMAKKNTKTRTEDMEDIIQLIAVRFLEGMRFGMIAKVFVLQVNSANNQIK